MRRTQMKGSMQIRHLVAGVGLFFLVGCGGNRPLYRAHDVLFDVPYIAREKKVGELALGMKQLSVPEVHEIFCRPSKLLETYNVVYLRAHNSGTKTYFVHILNSQLPQRKDIENFFDPYTPINTIGHIIFMVPIGIGLAAIAKDALTYFAGFLGISMATHFLESYALGVSGYQKLAKFAVVTDPDRGTPGLAVLPYRHEHYVLFLPRSAPNSFEVTLSVACKDQVTKEVSFDVAHAGSL